MARKKLRVGILFGGKSGEHEISLRSARSILKAIDRKKYDVVELGITKEGRWLQSGEAQGLLGGEVVGSTGGESDFRIALRAVASGIGNEISVRKRPLFLRDNGMPPASSVVAITKTRGKELPSLPWDKLSSSSPRTFARL